jgi:Zn finger protein HypA/HybF involved in hydrogenase expression
MFLDSSDKSQITLKGECQTCNRSLAIDIVPTPRGFGVMGGVLTDLTADRHFRLMCPICHTKSMQIQRTDSG